MTYPTLTLRRSELVARRACEERLALFDEICGLGGTGDALSFELSPLAVLWLARDASDVLAWLRDERFCAVNLSGVDLRWADLRWAILTGASLSGADLTGAALSGAYLTGALRAASDAPIEGWTLHNGRLQRALRDVNGP